MASTRDLGTISRRDFLRLGLGGASITLLLPANGCSGTNPPDDRTAILWIETGVCTGCACSLLGSPAPTAESLLPSLRLEYQETLMEGWGGQAMDALLASANAHANRYVLVVDGAIPTGPAMRMTSLGTDSTSVELSAATLVARLATQAAFVLALGTCASFGGIPGSSPGTTVHASVAEVIGQVPIRIPGCPPNPAWITSTLQSLLRGEAIDLDSLGRPTHAFGETVHAACPRLDKFRASEFATAPGDQDRCLLRVGCKGMQARGDCPSRLWQGRSYCIKANHPCIGCTMPGFLDARPTVDGQDTGGEGRAATPFYATSDEVQP